MRHAVVEYGSLGVDYRVSVAVSASVTIEDSVIRRSGGTGVYLEVGSEANVTALVRNNQIYDHPSSGLAVSNSATLNATVAGNLIYGTSSAVNVSDGGTFSVLSVTGNEIRDNLGTGLSISSWGTLVEPLIAGNEIRNNAGNGIYGYVQGGGAARWRFEGNSIHANSSAGLYLQNYYQGGFTALLRGNTIYDNSGDGVYLSDYYWSSGGYTKPQLNLNRIYGNAGWGIQANRTRGADIVHNQLSGNQAGGVYLQSLTETARVNYNDLGGDNGSYDLYNANTLVVDGRANWWGGRRPPRWPPVATPRTSSGSTTSSTPTPKVRWTTASGWRRRRPLPMTRSLGSRARRTVPCSRPRWCASRAPPRRGATSTGSR